MVRKAPLFALGALLFSAVFFAGEAAQANGRFPATNQLVFSPNPNVMALRATFGILVTQDRGQNWDWSCEQAVPYAGIQDPSVGFTANGNLVMGVVEGVALTSDNACNWSLQQGSLKFMVDTVVRPDAPHTMLALQNYYVTADDAGNSIYQSQVYVSNDDGSTFAPLGVPLDPNYVLETLEVAPTDPNRIYVSGFTGQGASSKASLFVSTDLGMHWSTYTIPFDPSVERAPFIAGVDPTSADRVYVRTSNAPGGKSRLYVTPDAGKTMQMVYSGIQLMGFAQSADGSKVYLGGPFDGMLVADRSSLSFQQRSKQIIQCLTVHQGLLYACSAEGDDPDAGTKGGFALGTSTDDGATFTPILHLPCVRGPLSCAAGASESACISLWQVQSENLGEGYPHPGLCGASDAGPDATPDASSPPPPRPAPPSGCGCVSAPAEASALGAAISLGISWLLVARRARSKRHVTHGRGKL